VDGLDIGEVGVTLSDDAFVQALQGVESDREMLLWVRSAMARECGVSEEEVVPTMRLWDLAVMMGPIPDGWDPLSFLLSLERVSGRRYIMHSWELPAFAPPFQTLGEWMGTSVRVLRSAASG
jgi:hypothetical protein